MSTDGMRMCELLVGLSDVKVLDVTDCDGGLRVKVETVGNRPKCPLCNGDVAVKDRVEVCYADLPCFGRPTTLVWRKFRYSCRSSLCDGGSFTELAPQIAAPRLVLTDRAARWATLHVGRLGRTVREVARELGCAWHAVMVAVVAYGEALIDDPLRFYDVEAIGLDETLRCRRGPYRCQQWSTQIVDVGRGQLLDVVPGRSATGPGRWLARQSPEWLEAIRWATLDLSGPYRKTFDTMVPNAVQVADPFHVVRLANQALDECRRRVQNETLGHRGRKDDPLYRSRRLLVRADERLSDAGRDKLLGLLDAGDPRGAARMAWHCKEVVRSIYDHHDPELALEFVSRLALDLQDESCPVEMRRLGRSIGKWRHQIAAWHRAHVSNGPTEAVNNLVKRVKRVAFGLTNFRNYRVRALLYAGKPNWALLPTIRPR